MHHAPSNSTPVFLNDESQPPLAKQGGGDLRLLNVKQVAALRDRPEPDASVLDRLASVTESLRPIIQELQPLLETVMLWKLLYTREETARMISRSPSQVDNLRKSGVLPVVYIDTKPLFHIDDILNLIRDRKRREGGAK